MRDECAFVCQIQRREIEDARAAIRAHGEQGAELGVSDKVAKQQLD